MTDLTPEFLLDNPALIEPVAPWCVVVDNLELGILLVAQPWLSGDGLRRADLEKQLARLGAELPMGPTYFQRVNRAVASLERRGSVQAVGTGRRRRFTVTPFGFATLILNLRVLRADPTVDGSEFELKRSLVAMLNLAVERLMGWTSEVALPNGLEQFLAQVDRVTVWERQVVTEQTLAAAFDILGLIDLQRQRVTRMLCAAQARRQQLAGDLDPSSVDLGPSSRIGLAQAAELIRSLAARTAVRIEAEARVERFTAYLAYLDALSTTYSRELQVVDLEAFRRAVADRE